MKESSRNWKLCVMYCFAAIELYFPITSLFFLRSLLIVKFVTIMEWNKYIYNKNCNCMWIYAHRRFVKLFNSHMEFENCIIYDSFHTHFFLSAFLFYRALNWYASISICVCMYSAFYFVLYVNGNVQFCFRKVQWIHNCLIIQQQQIKSDKTLNVDDSGTFDDWSAFISPKCIFIYAQKALN